MILDDTPRSAGLIQDEVNNVDFWEDSNSSGEVITIKWLFKGKKPIQANILLVRIFHICVFN